MNLDYEQLLEGTFTLFSHLLEIYGAFIIIFSGTFFFSHFLRTSKDGQRVRLSLARHLAFALEFKLGGEIIRTVLVRTVDEIFFLAAIILLRGILTLLIHWEIREERRMAEEDDL